MNVLIINYEFPPIGGGAGKATYNLAAQLASLGHHVDVLTSRMRGQPSREELDGMTVYRVMSWRRGIHDCGFRGAITFLAFSVLQFFRLTLQNNYDVIHYFFGLPSGILALLPGPQRKIPYIVSLRGSDVPGYDQYNKNLQMVHRLALPITKKIWKNAKAVVALSDSLKCQALQTIPSLDIQVISNGVDSHFLQAPPPKRITGNGFKLIAVARLIERKGLQDVLRALAGLRDPDISLLIVGKGNYEAQLKQLSHESSLDGRVVFYGFCHPNKLTDLLLDSDVFILPSRAESFGIAFVEAMACGLPVIGSDAGGIPDLISSENGILVTPGNVEMLRRAIVELKQSGELRMAMGTANRKKAMEIFNWKCVADQYVSIYHHITKI